MLKTKYECPFCGRSYTNEEEAELCSHISEKFLVPMTYARKTLIDRHKELVELLIKTIEKFQQDNQFKTQPLRVLNNHQGVIIECEFSEDIETREFITWSNFFDILTFYAPQGKRAVVQLTEIDIALRALQKYFGAVKKEN